MEMVGFARLCEYESAEDVPQLYLVFRESERESPIQMLGSHDVVLTRCFWNL